MSKQIQVLREIDKLDKIGVDGVRAMLGEGRRDESGAWVPGCDLMDWQTELLLGVVTAGRTEATHGDAMSDIKRAVQRAMDVGSRFRMMAAMEETILPDGRTGWDAFLGKLDPAKHSLVDELDKLVDAARAIARNTRQTEPGR